ncbi:MAG: FHA domain-containing protein [Bacteroidota bacterium]
MAYFDRAQDAGAVPPLTLTWLGQPRRFTSAFTLGRAEDCEVVVEHHLASRRHATVAFEGGQWWLRDLGSTNGTFLNGAPVDQAALPSVGSFSLGQDGPPLHFQIKASVAEPPSAPYVPPHEQGPQSSHDPGSPESTASPRQPAPMRPGAQPVPPRVFESVEEARAYYLDPSREAGEHTQIIRTIYRDAEKGQQRRFLPLIIGALLLCIVAVGFAGWQFYQRDRIAEQAESLFDSMRQQDVQIAQLMALLVNSDDQTAGQEALREQLAQMRARREESAVLYDGFIRDLGQFRKLSEREQLIYKTARIFNESHFTIPQSFVDTVNVYIRQWQSSSRFVNAVRRAEAEGYTPHIVRTFQQYGLPPEFFYLALQESNFEPKISGPWTRWGHAKGMWQFIPTTGEKYGLIPGPRQEFGVYDPYDERHDWVKATDAAARYILDIYSQLSQASGLLAMASYNWGEHRIIRRLDNIAPAPTADSLAGLRIGFERAEAALAGIPENTQARSYWKFYGEYSDRMPDETKGYVMHIFAAAVIGQNPRLFGIDMDNPLERYLTEAPPALSAHVPPRDASSASR